MQSLLRALSVFTVFACGSHSLWSSAPPVVADGQVTLATGLQLPEGVTVTKNGTVYVADAGNNRIVTVSSSGSVTPVTLSGYTLDGPSAIVVDAAGDLFIADSNNARVLEMKTSGVVSQVLGASTLSFPTCLTFDPLGDLYIGDANNLAIYEVTAAVLAAGGGTATKVKLANISNIYPNALAIDSSGNLYIADENSGNVYKLPSGKKNAQNVTPTGFILSSPSGLDFDAAGDWYVLDSGNQRIIEVPQAAGAAPYEVPVTGLATPSSLALDPQGNLYITDATNDDLTELVYSGNAINLGTVPVGSKGPSASLNYELNTPETLTAFQVTMQGDPGSEATIAAGTTCQFQSYTVSPIGSGNPITAQNPLACVGEFQGAPAFSGTRSGAIELLGPSNALLISVPFTETGSASVAWAFPSVATTALSGLNQPQGIAITGENRIVYIADAGSHQVYSWAGLNGTSAPLTTVSTAPVTLIAPQAVALDVAGDLFIADGGDLFSGAQGALGKIVIVPANTAIPPYVLATGSLLYHPLSFIFDANGNLYIGDSGPLGSDATRAQPGFVVKVPPSGAPILSLNTSAANLVYPQALATDSTGNLYIEDGGPGSGAGAAQILLAPQDGTAASVLSIPGLVDPSAIAVDPAGELWVLDAVNLTEITIVPPNGGALYTVPLTAPNLSRPSLAAFTAGARSLLISDIGHGTTNEFILLNGAQALLTFAQTAVGSSSSVQAAAIVNIGNSGLTPANGSAFSFGGNTQDFQVQNTSTCLSFTQLLPTQSCGVSADFAPLDNGVESEFVTSMFNSANQVQLVLTGSTTNSSSVTLPPTFNPGSGTFATAPAVTITDTQAGAAIYYTVDGTTPTTSSTAYHSPITVEGTNPFTLKAIAVASGFTASPVSTAVYNYNPYLGTNAYSTAGTDYANYINATYAVTGNSSAGYTVSTCSFYQPTGTVTAGANIDCGLILAPSPTTQSSSWLCHAIYSNPSGAGVGGWITIALAGCGTLPPSTAYWIATDNNDPHPAFPYGFWNCGGSCNGSAPTVGTGTYPYRYIAASYGKYTGMSTAMSTGAAVQAAQYVTLGINTPYQTATPAFSAASGNYPTAQTVTLSDATAGAVLYYTTDGSTPTTSSAVYHSAITVAVATTINALAVAPGYGTSTIASANYTFSPYLGTNAYSTMGTDSANYINATYAVTGGSPGGYTVSSCSFYQPVGTVTSGAKLDCGVILAPTPTTQSTSWLCHGTYANPSSVGVGGWVTVPLSGCGTLPAGTAYWIAIDNNDPHSGFPYGEWNCGGTCSGSAPATGAGTYPYRYIAATYGQYTGMGTAMLAGATTQGSQYVTLGIVSSTQAAIPVLSPGTGIYPAARTVSITDATSGAIIYYTTDGSTPTTASAVYSAPLTVTSSMTINALAVASGYTNSPAGAATYTFNPYLGINAFSTAGTDYANYINATYAVSGSNAHGYTVTSCSFYQPTGTVSNGAKTDCGLVLAPTPTTQSSSWLCHATHVNGGAVGAGAWITMALSGCGTLPAGTAYWVATDSNDPISGFPYGDWNCGSTCNGSAPTVGTGTYPYHYVAATYGTYTGMATAMSASGITTQASQFVGLTVVP